MVVGRTERGALSRERVLNAAIAVADAGGVPALTIRSLADKLGVKPMSVYHYVANKDEILDAIVDLVFGEIELPHPGGDWQAEMRRRAASARQVLRRHTWAITLLQSRTFPGTATLRHHDAVIGTLRAAGFSVAMTAHAFALIDSYVYGFALSEAALPIHGPEPVAEIAGSMMRRYSADTYPHLAEFTTEHVIQPGYDFGDEFQFGLNLILNGIAQTVLDEPTC
jgi:AcrR family transcriptional regulator